ncbi:MAG TPA: hypothetical protein VN727_03860 [Candidatus Binatia bacterium]|jgi:hypothetical protein|nr:hypothetical protein [Candidatus Binatia bacterium]
MIASLICVISGAALFQLMAAYCRSILASSRRVELSERVREVGGFRGDSVGVGDFGRLLQLVRLCPQRTDDQADIRAVGAYYGALRILNRASGAFVPRIAAWANRECEKCSYFAAVALDRRISYSRDLFFQQLGSRA